MSEIDKTIEELEQEVLSDLNEAEMKKDSSPAGKGAVASEPMKKVDAEEDEIEDLGAPVVKGDEKKADAAKKVKQDGSVKSSQKGDQKADSVKEETETDEEEVVAEAKLKEMGHKDKSEMADMPKTKAEMQDKMVNAMKKMKKGEMEGLYAMVMKQNDEMTDEEVELEGLAKAKEAIEKRLASINVQEDVDALMEGEDLSEDFQKKAATIFEAAVKSKIRPEVERIELEKTQEIAEDMESFKTELAEKVDGYLDYVVKEWMTENELAVERGLKGEIAEDFISGLKALFEEHYIDVPDEKYDILESQAQKIEELEGKLNETIGKLTEKKQSEDSLVRESVIKEVSSDLAETQSEKFAGLVEDVEFTDKDSFVEKLNTLKENYFPKSSPTQSLTEENESDAQEIDISDAMAAYTSAIKRSAPFMKDNEPFKNVKN
tara:strand:+ start:534 stop:1832 length:1299 start_codon:yes stop_codon:yes gene_type:complete